VKDLVTITPTIRKITFFAATDLNDMEGSSRCLILAVICSYTARGNMKYSLTMQMECPYSNCPQICASSSFGRSSKS
jgi:hypothetical protein